MTRLAFVPALDNPENESELSEEDPPLAIEGGADHGPFDEEDGPLEGGEQSCDDSPGSAAFDEDLLDEDMFDEDVSDIMDSGLLDMFDSD